MNRPIAPHYQPLDPKVVKLVTDAAENIGRGSRCPAMATGASDSIYLRRAGMPAYGAGGLFMDEDEIRAHGRDERIRVRSFYEDADFLWEMVTQFGRLP